MTRVLACLLILLTACTCSAAEAPADFFVATDGDDRWSGALPEPNAQGSDGPFATLQRARDAVRDLKTKKATDIVVQIREGTYRLELSLIHI